MTTLHIVTHTHWDREWFATFQTNRLNLVRLVDSLLQILENDPAYRCFMLDGQTVVLDDYLEIRPEREDQLRALIQAGRILVGPWHILPDEFLVSPEAIIRNLLLGHLEATRFGKKMKVGYIPDPFGHIGQMPQILNGFDIYTAAVWRGLDDQLCELWWQAPDGSRVLTSYLRDGYYNGNCLPTNTARGFVKVLDALTSSILPHVKSDEVLIMNGDDFMAPSPKTSHLIAMSSGLLEEKTLVHSDLPAYFQALQQAIVEKGLNLPVVGGELRSSKRSPMLVGVLSTRMWIKQRNHMCEVLLEKWAEPFAAIAAIHAKSQAERGQTPVPDSLVFNPVQILQKAWTLLMECHPHDSICGCSIDLVCEEMKTRFDQVEQIGEELTRSCLTYLAESVDTRVAGKSCQPVVVFNPSSFKRTDLVGITFYGELDESVYDIFDDQGQQISSHEVSRIQTELFTFPIPKEWLVEIFGGPKSTAQPEKMIRLEQLFNGVVREYVIKDYAIERQAETCQVTLTLSVEGEISEVKVQAFRQELQTLVADPAINQFVVHGMSMPIIHAQAVVPEIPGIGYRTLTICARQHTTSQFVDNQNSEEIENEFFHIKVDRSNATLVLFDKRTMTRYDHQNRFMDGGDAGDTYNYSPPAQDRIESGRIDSVKIEGDKGFPVLVVSQTLLIPTSINEDRQGRSSDTRSLVICSWIKLYPMIPRVDIHTKVTNASADHRLRVHFNAPIQVEQAAYDGHFEVRDRLLAMPTHDNTWSEQPSPEKPQRAFTDISDGTTGLMIANRGLPEVEVLANANGTMDIALTLMRSVGWLSRGDLVTRLGNAGPSLSTPNAQLLGDWEFDYSVLPHPGDWQAAYQQAYAFNEPLRAVNTSVHEGEMASSGSFMKLDSDDFVVSTIKLAEDKSGLILRGYNLTERSVRGILVPWLKPNTIFRARLDETPIETIGATADGSINFSAGAHQIVSLKMGYE